MLLSLCSFLFLLAPTAFSQKHTWQEAFKILGISWNADGKSLNRSIMIPMVPPTPDEDAVTPAPIALSQDIRLSPYSDAYVRLYIPVRPPKNRKLPLIIYLHGGDFVLYSASTVIFHNFCNNMAADFPAVVVSVEYRLAPEHRLPAAFDDALNGIFWARNQSLGIGGRDPWMEYADFSRVFLVGSSSGANIVYHAALRALDFNLSPLKIQGIILNQAYFGGVRPTQSETRLMEDQMLPLYMNHVLWTLVLPKRVNRDHEFCNPISGGTYLGRVFRLPKVYIKGDYGDPLVDRSIQLANFLMNCGVRVSYRFNEGGFHGIELMNQTAAQQLYNDMRWFVNDVHNHMELRFGDLSSVANEHAAISYI